MSRKIDNWHAKTEVPDFKNSHLEKDGDYVELECSPSKFDGSSSGESGDEDEGGLGDRHHRRPKNVSNFFVKDE